MFSYIMFSYSVARISICLSRQNVLRQNNHQLFWSLSQLTSPKREFAAIQSRFTPTVPLKHSAVLRSARRSLERIVRMRRKLLPQTAAAAAIRQRRETGENLSILNHGDVLMMPFAVVNGG